VILITSVAQKWQTRRYLSLVPHRITE